MKESLTRQDVLDIAMGYVRGDRENEYGDPTKNLTQIAELWSAYLGRPVCASDVGLMMVLMKAARAKGSGHMDSIIDIAGYAALTGEVVSTLKDRLANPISNYDVGRAEAFREAAATVDETSRRFCTSMDNIILTDLARELRTKADGEQPHA